MKTLEELEQLYNNGSIIELESLERERLSVARKIVLADSVVFILFAIITGAYWTTFSYSKFAVNMFALFAFFFLSGMFAMNKHIIKNYRGNFKTNVMKQILPFFDAKLLYEPEKYVDKLHFEFSKIFTRYEADDYCGEDWVSGEINGINFELSEIEVSHKSHTGKKRLYVIFKGIFLAGEAAKKIMGSSLILPAIQALVWSESKSGFFAYNSVEINSENFGEKFKIYSNNPEEIKNIVSGPLSKRLLDYKNKTGRDVFVSIINSKIYIALSGGGGFFEPKIFKSVRNFNIIKGYLEDFLFCLGITEDISGNRL